MALFEQLAVRYMSGLIRDFDLEDFQAAGIVGNGGHESGGFERIQEINPTVAGSAGGLGHFQWTGRTASNNRRLVFEQWLARNADKGWTPSTFEANYSMLFRELEGTEKAALRALRQTRTLDEATRVFCETFERPGIVHMEARLKYAERAMAAFKAAGLDAEAIRAQPRPGAVEILPPIDPTRPQAGVDVGQLLAVFLPVLQQLLANPEAQRLILPLVAQVFGLKPATTVPEPAPPPKPATPALQQPAVAVGLTSFFAGLVAQLNGNVAPPIGETATLPGILTTVLPIALTFLGGPLGSVASGLFNAFGTWAASRTKPS